MTELTSAEIDAKIAELKAQKRKLNPTTRKPRTKKAPVPTKKQRSVVCSYCGKTDKRANMERISKYEYQHPMCIYREPKTIMVEFTL